MSTPPIWHTDFLACYPAIIEQLKTVKQIKKVFEIKELAQLSRDIAPLDGCVYVIFDGMTPKEDNNAHKEQILELTFSIILAKSLININPTHVKDGEYSLGQSLTAIAKALQGYEPMDGKNYLSITPLVQKTPLPIRYEQGFGLFAFRFGCEVAVV